MWDIQGIITICYIAKYLYMTKTSYVGLPQTFATKLKAQNGIECICLL